MSGVLRQMIVGGLLFFWGVFLGRYSPLWGPVDDAGAYPSYGWVHPWMRDPLSI